jgi:hypothetical protein
MIDSTTGFIHLEGSTMVTVSPPTARISRTRRLLSLDIRSPPPSVVARQDSTQSAAEQQQFQTKVFMLSNSNRLRQKAEIVH